MSSLFCHVCQGEFRDSDLVLPININMMLPSGRFSLQIFMHYMCGLNYYLDNLEKVKMTDKDRVEIEGKLMEIMNKISKSTIQ